ncbi:MAG: hypothetical protein NT003_05175 [Candidatus Magasanikbacteria bacterium]|nr:hypothetical protein [Candidatus Magasanikbacteria bacterium]
MQHKKIAKFFFIFCCVFFIPSTANAIAPTWTAYDAGSDYSNPEGVQIRYNSTTNEFGLLYFQNGSTCCSAEGDFRLYFSTSTDGSTLGPRTTIEHVSTNVWAQEESVVNLAVSEGGQYVYLRPSTTRSVSDGTYYGQRLSDATWVNYSPVGLSNAFTRGTLLDSSSGIFAFATAYQHDSIPANRKIIFATTADNGINFSPTVVATDLTTQPQQVTLVKTASGYGIVWLDADAILHITFSTDGGATWSAPIDRPTSTEVMKAVSHISTAIDASNNIWVAYTLLSGPDMSSITATLHLLQFSSGATDWGTDETVDNEVATGVPAFDPSWMTAQSNALGIINGTTPIIAYYKLGSAVAFSAPGYIAYALRETGTGCTGADGANFRCGVIDSLPNETFNGFDSGSPAPMGLAIHGSRVVVAYPENTDTYRFRVAYTNVALDSTGGGGGGGGGIPEFSTYAYITTLLVGILFISKKTAVWKEM